MNCLLCGRENPEDARYCGGCGWPLKEEKKKSAVPVIVCIAAMLLIAAALVYFFRPLEKETPYEVTAESFVETYFRNDLPTMETLVQYHLYSYLEDELDTGITAASCSADAVKSELCTPERIEDIEMTLSFMGGYDKIEEAYTVMVEYRAEVDGTTREDSNEITVGRIGENWVVVSFRPFDAE